MKSLALACAILLSTVATYDVHALAVGSKKRGKTTASTGGGGFGAKENSVIHTPDTSESTSRLLQFLKAQNAKGLQRVEVGFDNTSGVRGLYALEKFKKDQYICQIPSDCALALSDPSKGGDDTPTVAHVGSNLLSMYLNDEKQRQMWAPYLDTLPTFESSQFDVTPDYFQDDELELLEFPRLIRQVRERKEQIKQVASEKGIDIKDLQFATWLVNSRAFSFSISAEGGDDDEPKYDDRGQVIMKAGEGKKIRVMVPFIDMANHSSDQPNAKLTLIDPEKDDAWFALQATRPIAAGKEIVIAYGTGVESSSELLLNYGFIPQSNKVDEFMLQKGGDECISSLDGWTTTLEEDETMLPMAADDPTLTKILNFRIKLKKAYK